MNNEPRRIASTSRGDGGSDDGSLLSESMGEARCRRISSDSASLLGENSGECQRMSGGSELESSLRLREIQNFSPEDYQSVEEQLQALVGRYIRRLTRQNIPSTRRYVSDVVLVPNANDGRELRGWLSRCGSSYPGGLFVWVDEGDHFHVVHDCPWSNGSCRCKWKQEAIIRRGLRKPLRRTKFIRDLDWIDWANVFIYFALQKWASRQEIWVGRALLRSPDHGESLRWRDLFQESREILGRQREGAGFDPAADAPDCGQAGSSIPGYNKVSSEKGGKFKRISEKVSSLLREFSCVPLTEIRNIIPEDHPRFDIDLCNPMNEKYFQSACALYQMRINKMDLHEFRDLYDQGKPIFYANNIDPFVYYHDRDTSSKFLIDLLKFQYNDNDDKVKELLINIVSWFNRKGWHQIKNNEMVLNPKINCVAINGAPNSGKNYFWDTIAAISTNVGHIGRVSNKCNQFSLQDAYNRRLVMGNELSMEDSAKEDFKKLCEGAAFNIRVKFQGDKIFTRTPVCFITNGVLELTGDPHFKNVRLVSINWRTCNLLAMSDKKPYPLALFDVFDYFGVGLK
ncbi:nonstructural protein [Bat-associated densovirus 1]|uniref:Nonstructural protein n=1 Tax=Bat-associated densovirus 1 TaxID=3070184 RepID=A0A7M1PVK9_9VIRU|nr:nonstructural protein [Bat associated densovirus]QOR29551.1 nonstructural protein [Bat-associated densovirus 1]